MGETALASNRTRQSNGTGNRYKRRSSALDTRSPAGRAPLTRPAGRYATVTVIFMPSS